MTSPVIRRPAAFLVLAGVVIGLCAGGALAQDDDNDGVPNSRDICNNTPQGISVDHWGRPFADLDQDCDVDEADLGFLVGQYTGIVEPPPEVGPDGDVDGDGVPNLRDVCDNTPPGKAVDFWGRPLGDLFHNCAVDSGDFSFLLSQHTGSLGSCVDGNPCDDGVECTTGDTCRNGVCVGTPRDALCDNGVFCDGAETCSVDSGCVAGLPVDCSSLDGPCAEGFCDEEKDACSVKSINNGQRCEDGLFCTVNERCDSGECISGGQRSCQQLDGQCAEGVCDEANDACVADPFPNGQSCDDGSYCTTVDACQSGECTGSAPRDCSYLDTQCGSGVCDDLNDECGFEPVQNGFGCDDGSVCTVGDRCQAGMCAGTALPDGFTCDDGNPDTDSSLCVSGQCVGTRIYTPGNTISYSCPQAGVSFTVSSFVFADDGTTLTVFGAPVPMVGLGGLGTEGEFSVESVTMVEGCAQTYYLNGEFTETGWVATFGFRLNGCGSCPWQSWVNLIGIAQ